MSLLKFKKNTKEWIAFYAEALRNRLRIDMNLSDVNDVAASRTNLGLNGDNNHTHYHDDRYLPVIDKNKKDLEKKLQTTKIQLDGRAKSSSVPLNPGQTTTVSITSVTSDKSILKNSSSGKHYLAFAPGNGEQDLNIYSDLYIDLSAKTLRLPTLEADSIDCSGNISGNDITGNRVFNAVWNDYAELFPRGEETLPGDIIVLDMNSDKEQYVKSTGATNEIVAGVQTDEFAMLIGGEKPIGEKDMLEYNISNYIPISLAGRVHVNVIGKIKKGCKIVPSDINGVGRMFKDGDENDKVVGYVLQEDNLTSLRKVKIRVKQYV